MATLCSEESALEPQPSHRAPRIYFFVMVPKWNLAVTRLVTRKEQNIPPMEAYFRNQRVEEAQYTKFGQIAISGRFYTKLRVTSRATFGMEPVGYYDLPKFGILGLLDALIPKICLYRVRFFVPCELQAL